MKQLRIGYLSTMHHSSHILKGLRWLETGPGIGTQWHLFGTGPAMVEAFAAGALDIGYIGLPPMMIAVGRGIPLVCIAGGHCEGTVMTGAADMQALSDCAGPRCVLQQFSGLKLGVPSQGSIHDSILRHMLEQNALGADCVVNYPWADLIAEDVRQGALAGAVGTPPLAVMCCTWYGHKILLPPASLWPFNPSCGIAVHRRMLNEAALLHDFLRLHEQACNMIRLEPGRAAVVVSGELKAVDAAFIEEVFAVSPRYCASLPPEYIEATMKFVPVLQTMGRLKEALSTDQVFNATFIKKIHPDPAHY
ncbi:MAG: ABC transporter substrate-binding protein [Deltaproteobacteria bacterium]|nr:ABC transporter substrate-binding protein [Deltaproteobacteria bacterium]